LDETVEKAGGSEHRIVLYLLKERHKGQLGRFILKNIED